jgi:hypothetical protein
MFAWEIAAPAMVAPAAFAVAIFFGIAGFFEAVLAAAPFAFFFIESSRAVLGDSILCRAILRHCATETSES